ncbi:MAG: CCA tRNA nucleotidyltransferase [Kiritimatiellia bacterium]
MNRPDLTGLEPSLGAAVRRIAERVRAAGGRALMVGGSVRDLLLGGIAVKDVDLEVFRLAPERLQEIIGAEFAFDACGLSFGVLKLKSCAIDVSLPRRESKRGIGHKGFLINSDPGLSVAEAASRRDFTVNAIYYDPLDDRLEDPCGGVADLERRILRHVSPKFAEDPLRVLRGMQFVARFALAPAPETVEICRRTAIEDLPPERIFAEWDKLLTKGVHIGSGLAFLRATGWVDHFPELAALIGCRQDPEWHPEGDVWNHTCLCLDAFARHRDARGREAAEDIVVGLAVLCHDFGKPATTRLDPASGRLRSLGHDVAGVAPTRAFLRRLTGEQRLLNEVPPLVREHMAIFAMWKAQAGDAAIRRLAARVKRLDRLIRVGRADDEGRPPACGGTSAGADLEWMAAAAERLRVADAAPKPILMGRHLIEMGFAPSPRFGRWLDACYEAQLDGAFSDLEGAKAFFRRQHGR